jgi:protein MpaA
VEGRPIRVFSFGDGPRTILLMAGVHGDEKRGVRVVRSVLRRLKAEFGVSCSKSQVPSLKSEGQGSRNLKPEPCNLKPAPRGEARIVVMPLANPDGYAAKTRHNARGIDINRNFPTKDFDGGPDAPGGAEPASEPETRAILDLVERIKPDVIITLHQSLACVNYNGDSALSVAERMSAVCDLPVKGDIGYPCPGSMGTYYGWERELPVITLELPKRGADLDPIERSVLDALGETLDGE